MGFHPTGCRYPRSPVESVSRKNSRNYKRNLNLKYNRLRVSARNLPWVGRKGQKRAVREPDTPPSECGCGGGSAERSASGSPASICRTRVSSEGWVERSSGARELARDAADSLTRRGF